jgi:pimeloyl-ACP methyl ester carboxylesterase
MKLVYRDSDAVVPGVPGIPAVVFHRDGMTSIDELSGVAVASGMVGRVVAPYGDYAFYPSGMEVGGICWYRALPGSLGTDPISLTRAVVQAGDLLDDLDLDRPVLIGWGQGGVVALGAGLLRAGRVGSVICVDALSEHFDLLPAPALTADPAPPVLLAITDPEGGPTLTEQQARLAGHGITSATWQWSGGGTGEDRDSAMAERIGQWLEDG